MDTVAFQVVDLLAKRGMLSVKETSEALGTARTTISQLALRLAKQGLIERKSNPFDARRTDLVLTDLGRQHLKDETSRNQGHTQ